MGVGSKALAVRKVDRMFKEIKAIIKDETAAEMNEMGKEILILAIKRAPYRTGYLVNSAFLDSPKTWKGNKIMMRLGFRASYAKAVEETHPTQRHYLQGAIDIVWQNRQAGGQPIKFDKSRAKRQTIKRIVVDV